MNWIHSHHGNKCQKYIRTEAGIHSRHTNTITTKRNIHRTKADIHDRQTNTNATKINIPRTEARIPSQQKNTDTTLVARAWSERKKCFLVDLF